MPKATHEPELPVTSFADVLTSVSDLLEEVVTRLDSIEEKLSRLEEGFILLYEQGIAPHTLLRIKDELRRLDRKLDSMAEDLRAQGVKISGKPKETKSKLEGLF